jgi:hypothetical protein
MTPLLKLPIGIQAFETMREQGYVYVDKTRWIHRLATEGMFYFMSRPRRFGKSLLVSTLKCLFEGRKELFAGLWLAEQTDWPWRAHPVIGVDFNGIPASDPEELKSSLGRYLGVIATRAGLTLDGEVPAVRFRELILALHQQTQTPVVVLIDEYDKPLIEHLGRGEDGLAIAKANRNILRGFFGVLKDGEVSPRLRFVLLTGVSRFSKVSVFSELNNLQDLSMNGQYADLLGYTQAELEQHFAGHLERFSAALGCSPETVRAKLALRYNGYRFSERDISVYNPFSILNALSENQLRNYWFASGTPTFLINLLQEKRYDLTEMEGVEVMASAFATFDLERLGLEGLLFQTGYLTIKDVQDDLYTLGYPNQEVKTAFTEALLLAYTEPADGRMSGQTRRLGIHLRQGKLEAFFETLNAILATIPYTLNARRDEAYFHTIFYLLLTATGVEATSEVLTSRGRIDLAVEFADRVYVIEFKCGQSAEAALRQIRERGYAARYAQSGKTVTLIGINFDPEQRNLAEWRVEGTG